MAKKKSPSNAKSSQKKPTPAAAKKPRQSPPASLLDRLKDNVTKLADRAQNIVLDRPADVISAIELDHESLRNYLKLLKDTDADMNERRRAYRSFSALLKSHSIAEERVVYKHASDFTGREMHIKIAEGFVEHHLADDLMARIEKTRVPMDWSAHANVLSEIVEHHLKEEERDLLPLIRKAVTPEIAERMLKDFLSLRKRTQKVVTEKNSGTLKKA